jgi:hypothetical protein
VNIGGSVVGVRSATLTYKTITVEVIEPFGNKVDILNCGYDATCTVEMNNSDSVGAMVNALQNGTIMSVGGGSGGVGFSGVITGVQNSFSVDGVETFSIEAKQGITKY